MKHIYIILAVVLMCGACAKTPERPNFIIVYTDDQRTQTLSCYDEACPIETPNIDRLATEGIRFNQGFVVSPICGVSRACLLSGQYMSHHQVKRFQKPLPEESFAQSYPAQLSNAGYYLGLFGKHGFGITKEQIASFDFYDATTSQGPAFRVYKGDTLHDAAWLTQMANDFLDSVPGEQPFCIQLNYKEPHPTSVPAPEDEGKLAEFPFTRVSTDTPEEHAKLPEFVQTGYGNRSYNTMFGTDEKMQTYVSHYYEKIMSVERSIGEITKMLEEKGVADNTVIIYLSDHGTHFGEKQLGAKWSPYDQSLRIPFIVYDPRSKAKGSVSEALVLNIDVAPTLLDLAGVPAPETMDGQSLKSIINGAETTGREHFFFEHFVSPTAPIYIPRNDGVRTKTTKYARWIDLDPVVEEFYDLRKDPMESNNLISDSAYVRQVEEARALFDAWREKYPAEIDYRPYQKYAQSGVKEMDWEKFREFRPKQYEKIKAEVDRLGVSWEEAMSNWEVRFEICRNAGYWY
ncbi:MAG: sulfatase-like hydrolase/transferase [Bacteroidetes bacterium]|nr:sulfatase-like hydrolase/transferase [Bacteroidota bacterium]